MTIRSVSELSFCFYWVFVCFFFVATPDLMHKRVEERERERETRKIAETKKRTIIPASMRSMSPGEKNKTTTSRPLALLLPSYQVMSDVSAGSTFFFSPGLLLFFYFSSLTAWIRVEVAVDVNLGD